MPFSVGQAQYEEIYDRNITRLAHYAAMQVHNVHDAEELASEALLILWQKQKEQEIQNPDAYATQILIYLTLNFLKKKRRRIETVSLELVGDLAAAPDTDIGMSGLPDELSDADREIILLRLYYGASFREIAGLLGLTEGSCRARFCRAKVRLRKLLTQP